MAKKKKKIEGIMLERAPRISNGMGMRRGFFLSFFLLGTCVSWEAVQVDDRSRRIRGGNRGGLERVCSGGKGRQLLVVANPCSLSLPLAIHVRRLAVREEPMYEVSA